MAFAFVCWVLEKRRSPLTSARGSAPSIATPIECGIASLPVVTAMGRREQTKLLLLLVRTSVIIYNYEPTRSEDTNHVEEAMSV